jgi:hypothetical protein
MDYPMNPQQFFQTIERFGDVGRRADLLAEQGFRTALEGAKVRGHRITRRNTRITVIGPQAPVVAPALLKKAAQGAQKEIRQALP